MFILACWVKTDRGVSPLGTANKLLLLKTSQGLRWELMNNTGREPGKVNPDDLLGVISVKTQTS